MNNYSDRVSRQTPGEIHEEFLKEFTYLIGCLEEIFESTFVGVPGGTLGDIPEGALSVIPGFTSEEIP